MLKSLLLKSWLCKCRICEMVRHGKRTKPKVKDERKDSICGECHSKIKENGNHKCNTKQRFGNLMSTTWPMTKMEKEMETCMKYEPRYFTTFANSTISTNNIRWMVEFVTKQDGQNNSAIGSKSMMSMRTGLKSSIVLLYTYRFSKFSHSSLR